MWPMILLMSRLPLGHFKSITINLSLNEAIVMAQMSTFDATHS